MKNGQKTFHHESLQDRNTITELLASLQKGMQTGTLSFSDEDNEITLNPEGLLNVVIRASSSSELNAIDIRISWQDAGSRKSGKGLKVSAG